MAAVGGDLRWLVVRRGTSLGRGCVAADSIGAGRRKSSAECARFTPPGSPETSSGAPKTVSAARKVFRRLRKAFGCSENRSGRSENRSGRSENRSGCSENRSGRSGRRSGRPGSVLEGPGGTLEAPEEVPEAYTVAQRTRELGIHLALGAQGGQIEAARPGGAPRVYTPGR